jgi:hypothetical protein
VVEAILGQTGEDRIDQVQPFDHRQLGPIQISAVAHKGLEEMMVRVNEAGIEEPAPSIDDIGTRRGGQVCTDGRDLRAFDQQIHIAEHGMRVTDDSRAALEEMDRHRLLPVGSGFNSCKRWIPGISMNRGKARSDRVQSRIAG